MNGRLQGSRGPGRGRTDHHIAAVAHHFLAGGDPCAAGGDTVAMVAARGPGPDAAYAAAGLAAAAFLPRERGPAGAGPPAIFLHETPDVRWSATAHLGCSSLVRQPAAGGAGCLRYWPRPEPAPARGSGEPALHIVNLGHLDEPCLGRMESVPPRARLASGAWTGRTHLLWCARPEVLDRRREALTVGRLCALVQPASLQIVVLPAERRATVGCGAAGPAAWRLGSVVSPGLQVAVTLVGGRGGAAEDFRLVLARLLA